MPSEPQHPHNTQLDLLFDQRSSVEPVVEAVHPALATGSVVAIGTSASAPAPLASASEPAPGPIRQAGTPLLLVLAVAAWAYGATRLQQSSLGNYGILASADGLFLTSFVAMVVGFVSELARRPPRGWLLGLYLVAVIVAVHATVPILYGTPEYDWVFKHIGITQAFATYGHITDSSNIYQQWPALFAAGASLSSLSHVTPFSYSIWAPLAFQLANALLLLGVGRVLIANRRVVWLALLLFEGAISWVGQDYYSPQAFAYLLWFGVVLVMLRWLRAPAPSAVDTGRLARLRAPLLVGIDQPPEATRAMRILAVVLVAVIFFAIVAAHQLTPYLGLAAVGGLTVLGLLRPRWLLLLFVVIAGAYLAPRYSLVAHDFGGLFSGLNLLANASGKPGTHNAGAEATTALIVRGLAGGMWLLTLAAIARSRRSLGRVAILAVLAFSPFVVLVAQSYGGEAVYRVFMFSAPWCALLIAQSLYELPLRLGRWMLAAALSTIALFAGLQGLYSPVRADSFTRAEMTASAWLYDHAPLDSLIVFPVDDFPTLDTANYNAYDQQLMPADPQVGKPTLNEQRLGDVEAWVSNFGHPVAYVVVSRSMAAYANYFGWPHGYGRFLQQIRSAPGWSVIYQNSDSTIYRLTLALTTPTAAPSPAAPTPAAIASPRAKSRTSRARPKPRGSVRKGSSPDLRSAPR